MSDILYGIIFCKKQIYWGIKSESMHTDPIKIAGHIGLTLDQEQLNRNLEVKFSYLVGPEYQGKGYATKLRLISYQKNVTF